MNKSASGIPEQIERSRSVAVYSTCLILCGDTMSCQAYSNDGLDGMYSHSRHSCHLCLQLAILAI